MTVFSFGGGQDSFTILLKIIHDKEFKKRHIKGRLIVVGSDTGDEHPHTYEAIKKANSLCKENNIEFYWITPDMGFHPKTWRSLFYQFIKNSSVGSVAFKQTCTDNLKIKVVDNFIDKWIRVELNYPAFRKKSYHKWYQLTGEKIRLILGFAAGEESRTSNGNKYDAVWKKKTVERYYPLIIENLTRQDCINFNAGHNYTVYPSNCMRCFYQSDQEILWLYRNYPDKFNEWVEVEKRKLEKYINAEKNLGVYGKITLTEKLEKAISLYGHWTDEELNDYKFSHGHCIKSKY